MVEDLPPLSEIQAALARKRSKRRLADVYPPNSDAQRQYRATTARIAIIGGSAGGGKTVAEFQDAAEYVHVPQYGAIVFRRTLKMHKDQGGLWDKSQQLFPLVGASPNVSSLRWLFPSGASIQFAGLENEASKLDYQGAEIPVIVFDELTHFLESQFFYLLSRNRWPAAALESGVTLPVKIRGSTNPAPGWVKRLLAPWVDSKFANPAKSGEIRWFIRENDQICWLDGPPPQRGTCTDGPGGEMCLTADCLKCFPPEISITFIRAPLYDNRDLLKANPEYVSGLKNLPDVDRRRLLDGDWDAKPANMVLDAFDESRNVVGSRRFDPKEYRFYIGGDFGAHNTAEVCIAEEIHSGHLMLIGEDWPGRSRPWDAIAADTKALLPHGAHITDGAGGNRTGEQGWREAFRLHGIPMAEPDARFCDPKLQYQVINTLFRHGELDVLETCTKTIQMINTFLRKIDPKTGDVTDDFDDSSFHLLSALRYILIMLRPPESQGLADPIYIPDAPHGTEQTNQNRWGI